MGCGRYENELRALLDGAVDDERMHELLRHCEKCQACSAELENIRRIEEVVRAAHAASSSPSEAAGRILAALPGVPVAPVAKPIGGARLAAYAAAAAVLLAAAAVGGFMTGRVSQGAAPEGAPVAMAIKSLDGDVLVRHRGARVWMPLELAARLYLGDEIRTPPRGGVVLDLGSECTVAVGSGSDLSIKSFNGETEFFLDCGSMTAALEGPHAPFYVTTPDGRIRALGTVFSVSAK